MKKILIIALLMPLVMFGQYHPPEMQQDTYVFDYTNTLDSAQKWNLNKKIIQFKSESSIQIAIVILKNTDGRSIEEVATTIFRKWGIGESSIDNGVLYVVVPSQRIHRMEVGYGLEGDLPDISALEIIEMAKPFFRGGDYAGGIEKVLNGTIRHLKPITWQQRELLRKAKLTEAKLQAARTEALIMDVLGWVAAIGVFVLGMWLAVRARIKAKLKAAQQRYDFERSKRIIKSFEELKNNIRLDRIKGEFDTIYALLKHYSLAQRYDFEKQYADLLTIVKTVSKAKFHPSSSEMEINYMTAEFTRLKNATLSIKSLFDNYTGEINEVKRKNKYVEDFRSRMPALRKNVEKEIKANGMNMSRFNDGTYKTILGFTGMGYLIYERVLSLEKEWTEILTYRRRMKEQKEKEKKRTRSFL